MNVQLSEESRRFIADQVASGRYPSEEAVVEDAITRLEDAIARAHQQEQPPTLEISPKKDPIQGIFSNDIDLIDEIVEDAMKIREDRPWRLSASE